MQNSSWQTLSPTTRRSLRDTNQETWEKKNMSHPHPHPQCREVTVKEATGAISWKLTWWNLTEWEEEGWCDVLQPS